MFQLFGHQVSVFRRRCPTKGPPVYTKPPRNEIGSEMPGGIDAAMIVVLGDKQITAATAEECKVLERKKETNSISELLRVKIPGS